MYFIFKLLEVVRLRVQEVKLDCNKKRYLLLDEQGKPVISVAKYLKFLDQTGKSSNTQKTYCYALKQYFDYLGEIDKNYMEIILQDLSTFVGWLRNPYNIDNVTPFKEVKAKRTERTINLTVTVVTAFYDYLYRNQALEEDVRDRLMKEVFIGGPRRYKSFLHHVNAGKPVSKNILKLRELRRKVKILEKKEIEALYVSTSNIRDRFLISLLFETGLRIGEALALSLEDFIFDHKHGHRIRLRDRGELSNGAKLKTGEREIYVSQKLMNLYDDYLYEVIDEMEIDTNFLFVKLHGKNKGFPMTDWDVRALFKRLREKTGIKVHPHLLRHTHATLFYRETKDIKQVQERLGHANIQTTMNMYVHPSSEEIRKNWEKAQSAFQVSTNYNKE